MTEAFANQCHSPEIARFDRRTEQYDNIGIIPLRVNMFDDVDVTAKAMSFWKRFKGMMTIDGYMIKRVFVRNDKLYRNLPA